jgi:TfoX/Sxy family transcriptional regulator of competence genes
MDEETLTRVRSLLSGRDGVVEKRMVGGRSFSLHGRMFCGVTAAGLAVRVGAGAVDAAAREPHVTRMRLGGRPLAAFVLVEPAGYPDEAALESWLERGLSFVDADPAGE